MPAPYRPVLPPTHPHLVEDLIARAKDHPLGTEFLEKGYLDSVAAGFEVHAFTVEAARERLQVERNAQ